MYQKRFGSTDDTLEAAGFRTDCPPIPPSLLLTDLRRPCEDLGRPPTREEFAENGALSRYALEQRIGWKPALSRVGATPRSEN
jgi:hypothetical protein